MNQKKKKQKAVALHYDAEKSSIPRVIAKGTGKIAEKIIDIAAECGVPVHNDPDLVEVLSKLDIDEDIPSDVYVVVAELLAFVYSMNGKRKG